MYILRVVIFALDEPNLTRILIVFKKNLVKYKAKRTSREYTFILFLILREEEVQIHHDSYRGQVQIQ